jgi:hypothetical protein
MVEDVMGEATRTAILLGLAALVIPAVWGYFAYRSLDWLWPRPDSPDGRAPRTAPPQRDASPRDADFLDFQI